MALQWCWVGGRFNMSEVALWSHAWFLPPKRLLSPEYFLRFCQWFLVWLAQPPPMNLICEYL